jgi:hypothetical protein
MEEWLQEQLNHTLIVMAFEGVLYSQKRQPKNYAKTAPDLCKRMHLHEISQKKYEDRTGFCSNGESRNFMINEFTIENAFGNGIFSAKRRTFNIGE